MHSKKKFIPPMDQVIPEGDPQLDADLQAWLRQYAAKRSLSTQTVVASIITVLNITIGRYADEQGIDEAVRANDKSGKVLVF